MREGDLLNLDDEKIAVLLRRIASKTKLSLNRAGCPDEESLATFVSGHFDDESRNQLESHLAICPFCLEDIVAAFKAVEDLDKVAVPERVRARAMALLQSPPDDRVFDFVEDGKIENPDRCRDSDSGKACVCTNLDCALRPFQLSTRAGIIECALRGEMPL